MGTFRATSSTPPPPPSATLSLQRCVVVHPYTSTFQQKKNCQRTLANHGLQVAKSQGFKKATSSSILDCSAAMAQTKTASATTSAMDVLDDVLNWVGEPRDHVQVASRGYKDRCRAGRLFACALVNPITNWKTTKHNGTMAKAHQNQRTSKSPG